MLTPTHVPSRATVAAGMSKKQREQREQRDHGRNSLLKQSLTLYLREVYNLKFKRNLREQFNNL